MGGNNGFPGTCGTSRVCASHCNPVQLFVTPWTVARQAPLSMGFFRQEYWSGFLYPPSRGSSQPRDQTRISCVSCIDKRVIYPLAPPGKPPWHVTGTTKAGPRGQRGALGQRKAGADGCRLGWCAPKLKGGEEQEG